MMLERPEIEARGRALVASIVALADQPEHVRELGAMLLELLEPGWSRDGVIATQETPATSEKHPTNAVVHMDPLELTNPATPARAKGTAMSDAERSRRYRRNKAAAKAAARASNPRQLALSSVTPVTQRHAPDVTAVTAVTASVTRDVTPSSSDLLSSPRLTKSLGEERESSPESCTPSVTRDAVTAVTLPEALPDHLRQMFRDELAHRPGVKLDADALWMKFRSKNPSLAGYELHFKWRHWCRTEWPPPKAIPVPPPPPTPPPTDESAKGEAMASAAPSTPGRSNLEPAGPGVHSAPVDEAERSRREERELRERRAAAEAKARREHEGSGVHRELAKLDDIWSPEVMRQAVRDKMTG